MATFFRRIAGTDPEYLALAQPERRNRGCRGWVDSLWNIAKPYLDRQLPFSAAGDFHSAFWEVFLTASLLDSRVALLRKTERQVKVGGPDLEVAAPNIWIEAIAPKGGEGPDAVVEAESNVARDVPDDRIILRLTNAIETKLDALDGYVERGVIRRGDPYVIAINGSAIPSAYHELYVPRVVRSVLPFGPAVVRCDRATGKFSDKGHSYRSSITTSKGTSVSTTFFQEPRSASVSALIYCLVNAFNPTKSGSRTFVLVHNPLAATPIPRGTFAVGQEWWCEGELIHCQRS